LRYTILTPISVDTLAAIMDAVENSIGAEISNSFGVSVDGLSHGTGHYLAAIACCEAEAGMEYPLVPLATVIFETS
jgi:hypothetical protein